MALRRSAALPLAALVALAGSLSATQGFASAMNEYTLSPSEMTTGVTTYQTQPYQPAPVQPMLMPMPTQPIPMETMTAPAAPQIGEIIYDTQPYMPSGQASQTETMIMQPYNAGAPTMIQPLL